MCNPQWSVRLNIMDVVRSVDYAVHNNTSQTSPGAYHPGYAYGDEFFDKATPDSDLAIKKVEAYFYSTALSSAVVEAREVFFTIRSRLKGQLQHEAW